MRDWYGIKGTFWACNVERKSLPCNKYFLKKGEIAKERRITDWRMETVAFPDQKILLFGLIVVDSSSNALTMILILILRGNKRGAGFDAIVLEFAAVIIHFTSDSRTAHSFLHNEVHSTPGLFRFSFGKALFILFCLQVIPLSSVRG